MKQNPHHDLLGIEHVVGIYKNRGLTPADDKIADEMIALAWDGDGQSTLLEERGEELLKSNPRRMLVLGALCEMSNNTEELFRILEKKV
ncbi:MAG: hypothetical protein NUV61_04420 [Candidatus Azambacteria bacterium]|nr:hypothetical protein [Candidatus Azambacteria bacterium]